MRSSDGTHLTPLVVAGSGRSGTTTMMQLLGSSPCVAFDRIYAYENAYLSYLIHLASVPQTGHRSIGTKGVRPAWRRAAIDQVAYVERHGFVGGLPWKDRPILDASDESFADDLLVAMWDVFSQRSLAYLETLSPTPCEATYYAETAPVWVADRAKRILSGRTVYLVRDPRDQWVSIMAFNTKRGFLSFGVQPTDTPETFAARFVERQSAFLDRVLSSQESREETVVRFEDLTEDRPRVAARLSEWLGVELSHEDDIDHREQHKTSGDSGTLERWRSEMPPEVVEIFRSGIGEQISAFGWRW